LVKSETQADFLDEAAAKGWTVVDMKTEWKVIYPFQMQKGTGTVDERLHSAAVLPPLNPLFHRLQN